MNKVSLFQNNNSDKPIGQYSPDDLIEKIKSGFWKSPVEKLRKLKGTSMFKGAKNKLPAITFSAEFKTRDKFVKIEKRLTRHSGLICLDVDKKDNPKMRAGDVIDNQAWAEFISCSGEGRKLIYKCKETSDKAEHKRIFDAAVERLAKKGINIKVDPIVKSIASLQYVTYDPDTFFNPKSKLVIQPLPAPKKKPANKPSESTKKDLAQLEEYLKELGNRDVTTDYEEWLNITFGITYAFGEAGRSIYHKLCKNYHGYSEVECDEKFDSCLLDVDAHIENPITLATVYSILNNNLPREAKRKLAKKYNQSHAVGVGEDVEQGDLANYVRYKLFLFKKLIDKETKAITELVPQELNLNAFENLLRDKGYFRHDNFFVWIRGNIAEVVDCADILRNITTHVENEGDYKFTYKKVEYFFSWEEIVHHWRKRRGDKSMFNQIQASLEHWQPNLLKDNATESFIPYSNGVLRVTATDIKLIPYEEVGYQIWRERILPRPFELTNKKGMFEEFFANVCGRGKDFKQRAGSEHYKRALWYFGYMLQGSKRQSTARAWLLYDIKAGNNGRSGKTIIGQAVGKIRSMVILDGKQIDFKNRFAFQTVQPWTDVVFIDDPSKYMSINPLFNMITGELNADRKSRDPLVKSVKFMIASNWVLEAEGASELGRQFVSQLDDYYIRYSKEHKNTITPIVDVHGKEFFTDWNEKDWSMFDSFCARSLQFHLSGNAPSNPLLGNSNLVRFIQVNEEELFFELTTNFYKNVQPIEGGCIVPQQLLISVVKESGVQANRCGKVVREYLKAVGSPSVEMVSIKVGGLFRNAYRLPVKFSDLDFGEIAKSLPKPKLQTH